MRWFLVAPVVAVVVGCADARRDDAGPVPGDCSECHGSAATAAPPADTRGHSDPALRGVGAHEAHTTPRLSTPVPCGTCHILPEAIDSPGHMDAAPAEVVLAGLATAGGGDAPSVEQPGASGGEFDEAAPVTCRNVYCHGATLSGGGATEPVWNAPDARWTKCGACHGNPPPAPHPDSTACAQCHGETVGPDGGIAHPERHIDGTVQVGAALACTNCHGDPDRAEDPAAPPVDTTGSSDTAEVTVGAHQSHLAMKGPFKPVECGECHIIPENVSDPGHLDPAQKVVFTNLSKADGANPSWNRDTATCSGVYCHGATLTGGTLVAPVWTKVDGSQSACGRCHGLPPPPPHPTSTQCSNCHETAAADGTIARPERHADGQLQAEVAGCNTCHGNSDNPAPPLDTHGSDRTTDVTVGAHQAHLNVKGPFRNLECGECHLVPTKVDDPGHLDPGQKVVFTKLAKANGATPSWDREKATCNGVYCHGATLTGGSVVAPVWTQVDGTQTACGSCHGLPPAPPHPANANCETCHETAGPGPTIVDKERHADGQVQVEISGCTACHGSEANAAPPVDTTGGTETTLVGVGAHQEHLVPPGPFAAVSCDACHQVPSSVDSEGHLGPPTLTFGGLAMADGATPTWDPDTATCSGVYCHGATRAGGSLKEPVWTKVDGTQVVCGTCHGYPPPPPHPNFAACGTCHKETATPDGQIAHPEKHADGTVQVVAGACTACHGSAANPAPPLDTNGNEETTEVTVGAHQHHLDPPGPFAPVACEACHKVPSTVDDPGHLGPPTIAFGGLAKADGADPSWDPGTATCSGAYCHGATRGGGTLKTPVWTKVDGTQVVCGTCHGNPPPPPHPDSDACGICHKDTASPDGTIVHPERHADGTVQVVAGACNSCHGNDANAAPPVDTEGASSTTVLTVGAHQSHLVPPGPFKPVACESCHKVPDAVDDPGHLEEPTITFGGLAKAHGANPVWNPGPATCSGGYCHGATLSGGTGGPPVWTKVDGTQAQCGDCHGYPPPDPHPQSAACGQCHDETADASGAIIHPEKHVDGVTQVKAMTCNSCHGTSADGAPPPDTGGSTATTSLGVGAHQAHLKAQSGISAPVACDQCHVVPSTVGEAGHLGPPTVTFGALAKADGAGGAAWNEGTARCSNVYCHGATLTGNGSAEQPLWTKVDNTQDTCGSCHEMPPTGKVPPTNFDHFRGEHENYLCSQCHTGVNGSTGIATPATHVNGTVDTVAAAKNCSMGGCH